MAAALCLPDPHTLNHYYKVGDVSLSEKANQLATHSQIWKKVDLP